MTLRLVTSIYKFSLSFVSSFLSSGRNSLSLAMSSCSSFGSRAVVGFLPMLNWWFSSIWSRISFLSSYILLKISSPSWQKYFLFHLVLTYFSMFQIDSLKMLRPHQTCPLYLPLSSFSNICVAGTIQNCAICLSWDPARATLSDKAFTSFFSLIFYPSWPPYWIATLLLHYWYHYEPSTSSSLSPFLPAILSSSISLKEIFFLLENESSFRDWDNWEINKSWS